MERKSEFDRSWIVCGRNDSQPQNITWYCFEHLGISISDLFRISVLEFRIYFSFNLDSELLQTSTLVGGKAELHYVSPTPKNFHLQPKYMTKEASNAFSLIARTPATRRPFCLRKALALT